MDSQISREDRISLADDIIDNEQNFQSVQTQLKSFTKTILIWPKKMTNFKVIDCPTCEIQLSGVMTINQDHSVANAAS